tara:strand:+ start:289 stop:1614 length:1326 start_codon:yes stop_codon:yes gene_type:complete
VKFIYADTLDYVDPRYDFVADRSPTDRELYWDDVFPHELLGYAPYDGLLVSRSAVGNNYGTAKYTQAQTMRFRRVGAREFLRYRESDYPGSVIFGDSGAFAYHKREDPPYTAEDMVDFYGDGQFTHGCSVDHIIFDFLEFDAAKEANYVSSEGASENKRRHDITLANANDFLTRSKRLGRQFTPLGVIQGWSPLSMAKAAKSLKTMGFNYLGIGGLVPLSIKQIKVALGAIFDEIGTSVKIHLLGFAKADGISEFGKHNIASFDTTSPLIRAFKDTRKNYYLPGGNGALTFYSAIRVPQSMENHQLKRLVKEGRYTTEDLQDREQNTLRKLRAYDSGQADLMETLQAVMDYTTPLLFGRDEGFSQIEKKKLSEIEDRTHRTLSDAPWKKCSCSVCKEISIEVVIFRASNRNKRRGIHNLGVYQRHIKELNLRGSDEASLDL